MRYHRPSQFAWRLCRTLQRHWRRRLPQSMVFRSESNQCRWKPDAATAFRRIAEQRLNLWPGRTREAIHMPEGSFRFLNETRCLLLDHSSPDGHLESITIDWNPKAPRLWRFHLQCQEGLLELAEHKSPDAAYRLIESWLGEPRHRHPMGDPDAWHPFCISRRLPVWLSLAATYEVPQHLVEKFWSSVFDQISWLSKNCEWDLGGNHLLENLTALFVADSFLQLKPELSLEFAAVRLASELNQQVLPSGEHFERAPTYHALMLVSVLHCVEAAKFAESHLTTSLTAVAKRMWTFADWLRQPHGAMPLLGDSVAKETPDLDRLQSWVSQHSDSQHSDSQHSDSQHSDSQHSDSQHSDSQHSDSQHSDSQHSDSQHSDSKSARPKDAVVSVDYWASEANKESRILFDVGPLACDHLPAHGHADLLQVVASIHGHDAIVDTGNFQYESGERRLRCRQTAAHNVAQVGDLEHCDLWSSFRMGRRGHPAWTKRGELGGLSWCAAAHDGFGFLTGRAVIATANSWTILDWFANPLVKGPATSRLHWHPDWDLSTSHGVTVTASLSSLPSETRPSTIECLGESIKVNIAKSSYYADFGQRQSNDVIENSRQFDGFGWLGFHIHHGDTATAVPEITQSESRLSVVFPGQAPLVWQLE